MQIDWEKGAWRVCDVKTGAVLGKYKRIVLAGVTAELVLNESGSHGWLIVAGELTAEDDTATIRNNR